MMEEDIDFVVQDEILSLDDNMADHTNAIACTIFLFLLTHAPTSWEETLRGYFTRAPLLALECGVDPPRPFSALCEILGAASALIEQDDFERFLQERVLTWKEVLRQQTDVSTVYRSTRLDSETLYRHHGKSFDHLSRDDRT